MQSDWRVEQHTGPDGSYGGLVDLYRDGRIERYELDEDEVERHILSRDPDAHSYVLVEPDGYRTTVELRGR